jgi:hypothetical protein
MPAAADRPSSAAPAAGHSRRRGRPWRLVAWVGLAALLAVLGPSAALAHPPGGSPSGSA